MFVHPKCCICIYVYFIYVTVCSFVLKVPWAWLTKNYLLTSQRNEWIACSTSSWTADSDSGHGWGWIFTWSRSLNKMIWERDQVRTVFSQSKAIGVTLPDMPYSYAEKDAILYALGGKWNAAESTNLYFDWSDCSPISSRSPCPGPRSPGHRSGVGRDAAGVW